MRCSSCVRPPGAAVERRQGGRIQTPPMAVQAGWLESGQLWGSRSQAALFRRDEPVSWLMKLLISQFHIAHKELCNMQLQRISAALACRCGICAGVWGDHSR